MKAKFTLKSLMLTLVLAAVLPLLVLSIIRETYASQEAIAKSAANLQFSATLVAANQELVARSAQQLLVALSQTMAQSSGIRDNCSQHLEDLVARLPQYVSMAMADFDGNMLCSSNPAAGVVSVSDRKHFLEALQTRSLAVGEYAIGRVSGKPTVQFALPVKAYTNARSDVIFASLDLDFLARQVGKIPVPPGSRLLITDPNGIVLAVNPAQPDMIGSPLISPVLKEAIKAQIPGVREGSDGKGGTRIYAFAPPGNPLIAPFFVSVSMDREVIVGPAEQQLMVDALSLLAMALLGSLVAWHLAGRSIVQPAAGIVEATRKIQRGARDVRIAVQHGQVTTEFSSIAEGFNLMADSLDRRQFELEAELARSRQTLAMLDLTINSMKEGLITINTEGEVTVFNSAAEQLFLLDGAPTVLSGDWSAHHGLFMPGSDRLYPVDNLPLMQALNGKSGATQHVLLRNAKHPDGRLLSCSFRPMVDVVGLYGETIVVGALMVFADITQLQQIQQEQAKSLLQLSETKRRLEDAQRIGQIGSWEVDTLTHRVMWSDAALELMGLEPDAFDGNFDSLINLVHPDDVDWYNEQRLQAWNNGGELSNEYRIVTLTGEVRWLYQIGRPRPNERDDITKRSGVIQDITKRKVAELAVTQAFEELSKTQQLLIDAQRMGRIGHWEYDLDRDRIWVSSEVFTLFGLQEHDGELNRDSLIKLIHPEDVARYCAQQSLAASTAGVLDVEYRIITPTGDVRWMHQIGQPSTGRGTSTGNFRSGMIQDITDRKRVELALTASFVSLTDTQRKLSDAQKLGRIGHWELDFATQRTWWSDEVYHLFDHPIGSFDGRPETFMAVIHPHDFPAFDARRQAAWMVGGECDAEFRIITPTGEVRWMHQVCQTHVDDDGKPSYRSGMLQDITTRKVAELALVASFEKLERTQDKLLDAQRLARLGSLEVDLISGALWVSEEIFILFGLDKKTFDGKAETLFNCVHPEDRAAYDAQRQAAWESGEPFDIDYRILTPSGEGRWLNHSGSASDGPNGAGTIRSSVIRDITARKLADIALTTAYDSLANTQRKLIEAQQLGRIGNWEFDLRTNTLWWSDECYVLMGFEKGTFELTHDGVLAQLHPDDQARYVRERNKALAEDGTFEVQYRIIQPDGQVRWIHQRGQTIHSENGEAVLRSGLLQDITERKLGELALEDSVATLTKAQRKLIDALHLGKMGTWEFHPDTGVISLSAELYALFGHPDDGEVVTPASMRQFIHPDDLKAYYRNAYAAHNTAIEQDIEYRIVSVSGDVRWMHQYGRTYQDAPAGPRYRAGVLQDITERKAAELALTDSLASLEVRQQKLLQAQQLGRMGNWESDVRTGMVWLSDELYAIAGRQPDGSVHSRETLLSLLHPDDRTRYVHELAEVLAQAPDFQLKFRILTPEGEVRWLHQIGRTEHDAQGQAVKRIGVIQDVTEREASKQALMSSLEMLQRTGEMARIGGWSYVVDGDRLECTDELLAIYDLPPGAVMNLKEAETKFFSRDAWARYAQALQQSIDDGSAWDLELPVTTSTGRQIWVRSQGQAQTRDARYVGMTGALQDITVQYQAREKERLYKACMNQMTDMVMVTEAHPRPDMDARTIVYANDALVHFTGYSRAELEGQTPMLFSGPQTSRVALSGVMDALDKRAAHRTEILCHDKSSNAVCIELDVVPIFDESIELTHWVWVARDMTVRKQAEKDLLDSEQRYMALFNAAPLPMMVVTKDNLAYLTVNAAAITSYGFSLAEFQAMTAPDLRVDAEQPELRAMMKETLPDHLVLRSRHRRKDGSEFPIEAVVRAVSYNGAPAWFVVTQDVSARTKAEKDVQDQLFTMQRAADAAQAITAHQTLKGAMQEVADQACGVIGAHQALVMLTQGDAWNPSIYGLSLSEKYAKYRGLTDAVDGTGIYAIVSESKRPVRLTQAELEAHPRWRGFGTHADKHPAMRGWLAVPLMGRNGVCIGVLQLSDKFEGEFTLLDEYVVVELAQLAATALENARLFDEIRELNAGLEQKVIERTAALSRQEALFRALADEAPQAIWTITAQSEVTYFNRAFMDIAGGNNVTWLGQSWLKLIHPEDLPRLLQTWAVAVEKRAPYANLRRIRDQHGVWRTMSCTASPVFTESGEIDFWVGIDTDITEIKATEAALRLSNQELEAFSYSVSHDLRSPLNTIDGFSRLLAKQMNASANEKSQHYLTRIQAGVAQMGQLIEDLLSLAQVSRMQLRVERVDLSAVSQKIVDEWRVRAPEREVNVSIEPNLVAFGDSRLLRVVMDNLLGNAWKFTAQRTPAEISVGQTLEADTDPVFFVSDNGAGFDLAYADKLFTAFQRLHGAQEFPGSGIGLATVSRVIGRHGGKLWTQAKVNQGARFYFTLPNIMRPR